MTTHIPASHDKRVLHVDDDPSMLELVAERLGGAGFQVTSLDRPELAVKRLLDSDIRVCILDISMPRLDGLRLLEEIMSLDAAIQVVMLTGVTTQSSVLDSYRGGAEACFFKPIADFAPLVEALEACFVKADRWWEALRDLRARTKATYPRAHGEPINLTSDTVAPR